MSGGLRERAARVVAALRDPDRPGLCECCLDADWIEAHHVWPTHLRGPADGPLARLCPNCHRLVHRLATRALKGAPLPDLAVEGHRSQVRLGLLVRTILDAALYAAENDSPAQPRHLSLKVSQALLRAMHRRRSDLGFASLPDYVRHLIERDTRGL